MRHIQGSTPIGASGHSRRSRDIPFSTVAPVPLLLASRFQSPHKAHRTLRGPSDSIFLKQTSNLVLTLLSLPCSPSRKETLFAETRRCGATRDRVVKKKATGVTSPFAVIVIFVFSFLSVPFPPTIQCFEFIILPLISLGISVKGEASDDSFFSSVSR